MPDFPTTPPTGAPQAPPPKPPTPVPAPRIGVPPPAVPAAIPKPVAPSAPAAPPKEADIHVMPEKFIGAAAGRPAVAPAPVVGQAPKPVPSKPAAPPPPPVGGMPRPPAPKKKGPKLLIIIGVIIVLGGGAYAAYLVLAPKPVPVAPPPVVIPPIRNVNVAPPPPPPEPPPAPPPAPVVLRSGPDADSDGLTDAEEATIYHTDPHNVDTDGDSFNDGNESSHLYDPSKKTPAKLEDSGVMSFVKSLAEITPGPHARAGFYFALVPANWQLKGATTTGLFSPEPVFATAPTGEFFEVLVTEKPVEQSLIEWYLAQSPGTAAAEVERFRTAQGYDALRAPDRLTTYVDAGDGRVFTLVYNVDDQADINFRTTYEVFINSFFLTEEL